MSRQWWRRSCARWAAPQAVHLQPLTLTAQQHSGETYASNHAIKLWCAISLLWVALHRSNRQGTWCCHNLDAASGS